MTMTTTTIITSGGGGRLDTTIKRTPRRTIGTTTKKERKSARESPAQTFSQNQIGMLCVHNVAITLVVLENIFRPPHKQKPTNRTGLNRR